ncbi:WD40-repeat-containing domain protein [Chytridium lagenaria]|nr:WD40-repeat-containing domain protein [Chytridium lagenaria]
MADEGKQVQVRFRTRSAKFSVTDTPILIPVNLRRFGLSEIINHLLGSTENPVPFDFIIDGKFLRTTLETYIEDHNLSSEAILEIEYVESTLPPKPSDALKHDDWISGITGPKNSSHIATSSYDGKARIWNLSGALVGTVEAHEGPVKCISWLKVEEDWCLLTGGEDGAVYATQFDAGKRKVSKKFECVGHEGSVDGVSVNKSQALFATASWDQTVRVWTAANQSEEDDEDNQDFEKTSKAKRKRLSDKPVPVKKPTLTLGGHGGAVSSVCFSQYSENDLFSGGWDHSLRIWDVEANRNLIALPCECVILDIDQSTQSTLLASGHTDDRVRLWDPGIRGLVVKLKLSSHSGFTSAVSWSPSDAFKVASASYDGTVKVWDIRSTTPLHSIKGQRKKGASGGSSSNKLHALEWDGDTIFFGGEAGLLEVFNMTEKEQ